MGIHITAYQRATTKESITLKDAAGDAVELNASDKVRVKIGRAGEAPKLDITSGTDLGGGSSVTAENPATLTLDEDDLGIDTIKPGIYDIEVGIIDSGDQNRYKPADFGVFVLLASQS